jgi:Cu+-exporting ATPase
MLGSNSEIKADIFAMNIETKTARSSSADAGDQHKQTNNPDLAEITLPVDGMSCASCAGRVEKALHKLSGVSEADVNLALNNAHLRYDGSSVGVGEIVNAIKGAGYDVPAQSLSFDIDGMTCASCSGRVEKALRKLPGVTEANVNLALERADVHVVPGQVSDRMVIEAVEKAGYHAVSRNQASNSQQDGEKKERGDHAIWWLVASVILAAPLIGQMIWMHLGVEFRLAPWMELALATPVQFIIGWRFYRGAWMALRNGAANMDVLVTLGTSAAYFLSLYNMFTATSNVEGHLYFEASATIVTLILAGKIMEERAKRGASAAIRELMALRPRRARRVDPERGEEDVAIEDLQVGDTVRVRPGERLPIDGTVVAGESEVDESLITGETRPVSRKVDDEVVGGAVNGTGRLDIRVTAIGEDTTLSRIIRLVEQAQTGKAPVQQLVDKVAAVFVPVIIAIALVTFGAWLFVGYGLEGAIVAAVSVLVIACPCALGLATPTALVAGTGAAAKAGILIRNFEALEQAHNVDMVVFDKTGTLTEGVPTVHDVVAANGFSEDQLLQRVASLQAASEHPLAQAVVTAAKDKGVSLDEVSDFQSRTGAGVGGTVSGHQILIGTQELLEGEGASLPDAETAKAIADHESKGRTVILTAIDGTFAGYLTLEDKIRETAIEAVRILKQRGIESAMLSGDAEDVAAHVANEIGLSTWRGRIRPQDKALEIEKLRKKGHHVAMVGDGINDAPALAAADVGIAMGGGTDVAMETAGITLMRSDPKLVAAAIEVSVATRRKIAQNLFWAFGYNVIGVPLAAFGILSPAIAGAAMALSSVSVVSNSLMLRRWRARGQEA